MVVEQQRKARGQKEEKAYLSDEYDNTENEPDPGSYNAEDGSERDLIDGMAVISPSFTEADVSKADRAPSEESRQSRQGKKPVEDHFSLCIQIDICQSPTDENHQNRRQWTTGLIDVGEDLRRIAFLSQCSERARPSIHARNTNRED